MGAAGRRQARPEAVTVPGSEPLTCRNVAQQQLCRNVRSVRIAGLKNRCSLKRIKLLPLRERRQRSYCPFEILI